MRVKSLSQNHNLVNYNQIYVDFGLCHPDDQNFSEHIEAIQKDVILMAPLLLAHEDIKDATEEQLIFHQVNENYTMSQACCIRGLPTESGANSPLLFLVPHLMMQKFYYAVSFLNISTILYQFLVVSWLESDAIK